MIIINSKSAEDHRMWIAAGIMSVIFCMLALGMSIKKNGKACWASACSLSFVAITLLMEYRLILNWVNKNDWNALMDVVPSMYGFFCRYVVIMLILNAVVIVLNNRQ